MCLFMCMCMCICLSICMCICIEMPQRTPQRIPPNVCRRTSANIAAHTPAHTKCIYATLMPLVSARGHILSVASKRLLNIHFQTFCCANQIGFLYRSVDKLRLVEWDQASKLLTVPPKIVGNLFCIFAYAPWIVPLGLLFLCVCVVSVCLGPPVFVSVCPRLELACACVCVPVFVCVCVFRQGTGGEI